MDRLRDPETLPDLVARERRTDHEALRAEGARRQVYTYHRFCTTAWRTGNFLRHLGVRDGSIVAVADDRAAAPVLALFGTALLGGTAWIGAPREVDARAVVAPVEEVADYDLPPGGQRAGYGGDPDDPSTYHFEEGVWSENPARVPETYDPDATVLTDGERGYTHADLLGAAVRTVDRNGIDNGDVVAVRASLADPGVVAAGVLAPLIAGATAVLGSAADLDADSTLVVGGAEDGDDAATEIRAPDL